MVAACTSKSFQAVLQDLAIQTLDDARIVLTVPHALQRTVEFRRGEIVQLVSRLAGRPLTVEFHISGVTTPAASPSADAVDRPNAEARAPGTPTTPTAAPTGRDAGQGPVAPAPRPAPQAMPASSMSDHPLVRQATELLGARLLRVEKRESGNG